MDLPFTTLDVFTSTQLEGNPLAVVQVPASLRERLTQPLKQKIAREFNLSETVFLHDDTSKSGQDARDIDIFTIEQEIVFAGHPTVGTAVLVQQQLGTGVRSLVTKAGPISIEPSPLGVRARIPHNVHLHAKTLGDLQSSDQLESTVTAGLHPNPAIRAAELEAPVFSIVNGMTFALVRLASLELLREVQPLRLDFEALAPVLLDEGWRDSFCARYYYVDVEGGQEEEDSRCFRTRMVELGFEDPATGSAASALCAYLTLKEEKKGTKFRVTQGIEMGRKSVISVETTVQQQKGENGEVDIGDVYLGGTAVVVMQGTLKVSV
ncbi:hypothetical protein F5B22DRAFT_198898 [Xylaria bambusicola]|uniref:uncharacterized protein n=1 Tax=Xylaria bambusicola TaxID=326684 RepID=UPI002008DB0E|nr:uncharacterized protein F5B22DRAFT_198898 [Xylaria bambusicola]KAI0515332.1 hypothetical protein F5B22DRAFT_198898 [Xylaria bambusicola]